MKTNFHNLYQAASSFKGWVVLIMLVTLPWKSFCQRRLSLGSAFELLGKQNIDLAQTNLNKLLAEQEYRDAKNNFIPQVNIGASHNYNLGLAFDQVAGELVTGNRWSNTANANIGVRTTVFQGFSRLQKLKIALLGIDGANLDLGIRKKALEIELLSRYFDVLAYLELYKASLEQMELSKEQYALTKEAFDLGNKVLVDISAVESQLALDELRMLTNKNAHNSQLLLLKELLQIPLQDSIVLESPDMEFLPTNVFAPPGRKTMELRRSVLSIQQAELQLKSVRSGYYPTLSFTGGYGTNYSSRRKDNLSGYHMPFADQVSQNKSLYMGVSLSLPILNSFNTKSAVYKAKINIERSKTELEKTKIVQERTWRSAVQDHLTARQEYQAYQKQVEAAKVSYEAMKERYAVGMTTALELSKTRLDYNLSVMNFIRSKYLVVYWQEVLKILEK